MGRKLRILHTNDLHSEFSNWPSMVAMIKKRRAKALENEEDVLLFDIGDHTDRVHPITDGLRGKGNVDLMNVLNYDAVTIGNNEGMTFSKEDLNELYENANFPVVLCNLFEETGELPIWATDYKVITTKDNMKVGVTGVTAPFQLFYQPLGWEVRDPFPQLKEVVKKLRPNVDLLICLSHLGLFEDERMAKEIPEIDLILGAHTHQVLENGKQVGETWINQSGRSGKYLGEVCIDWENNEEDPLSFHTRSVKSLKVDLEEKDEETVDKLNQLFALADEELMEEIVLLKESMTVNWYKETPIVKMLAEGLKEWCVTEISMVNAGIILDDLHKGNVTYKDIHRICPHPINPAVVKIPGENLLEIIRQSRKKEMVEYALKGFGFRGKILGEMIFDGVSVNSTSSYVKASEIIINGEKLDRNRIYTLATLDMYTFGHLYPAISSLKETTYFMPEFLRNVLAWKLQKEASILEEGSM